MERGTPVIEARGLIKRFADVTAVDSVTFSTCGGELFGFLGPNGAGKTTTINMLTGLARPDAGTVRIGGIDCTSKPKAAQRLIGVVPDESNLYPELTGFRNLCFCGALYGMTKRDREHRARELLESFELTDAADRRFAHYSKGMKRKLTVAAGIMHRPQILFLDEPTTGLDVASARHVRGLIATLHQAGTTIFLTTHYIEEAERLCSRIAFIVSGRIVKIATVEELLEPSHVRHTVEIEYSGIHEDLLNRLGQAFPDFGFSLLGEGLIRVQAERSIRVGLLIRYLEELGVEVAEARRVRPSLEDVFVQITGIEAEAMRKEKAAGRR